MDMKRSKEIFMEIRELELEVEQLNIEWYEK